MNQPNLPNEPQFDAKEFKRHLAAVFAHHHLDEMTGTGADILAELVDHTLQSFARAIQDHALRATLLNTSKSLPDNSFLDGLLGSTEIPPQTAQEAAPAPRVGPTKVSASKPMETHILRREATETEYLAMIAAVNAAPSPVMVKITLNDEPIVEGATLGQKFGIGETAYTITAVLPDKTLLLMRDRALPLDAGG